jgi:hypothetical protein
LFDWAPPPKPSANHCLDQAGAHLGKPAAERVCDIVVAAHPASWHAERERRIELKMAVM